MLRDDGRLRNRRGRPERLHQHLDGLLVGQYPQGVTQRPLHLLAPGYLLRRSPGVRAHVQVNAPEARSPNSPLVDEVK
jgi:hypothetical protein